MMMIANLNSLELKNDIGRDGNINKPATDGTFYEILVNNVLLREDCLHGHAHEDTSWKSA